jgi:hypothetical protein
MLSNERRPSTSSVGGTAEFENKNTPLTPSERLKVQLNSGKKPHPLILLPEDGKFWCDPPQSNVSTSKYFLSCFDMEKEWKKMYGDDDNIDINPSDIAADAYLTKFSQVRLFNQ